MIAIIIQSLKTIFKFIDFEKKIDYFSILFTNLCILIVIFTIPFMKIMYYYLILQIKVYCSFCNNYFWIFISFS